MSDSLEVHRKTKRAEIWAVYKASIKLCRTAEMFSDHRGVVPALNKGDVNCIRASHKDGISGFQSGEKLESLLMRTLTCVWYRQVACEHVDELATTDAVKDDAEMAEQVAKDALNTRTKVAAAIRHGATFDDEVGELVDVEYVSEEDTYDPK